MIPGVEINIFLLVLIGTQLIMTGKSRGTGVVAPEFAFDPEEFFAELAKRGILIHEKMVEEQPVA